MSKNDLRMLEVVPQSICVGVEQGLSLGLGVRLGLDVLELIYGHLQISSDSLWHFELLEYCSFGGKPTDYG